MKTLLRVDCSSTRTGSHSKELSDHFEVSWRKTHPQGKVIRRDLIEERIPHIESNTITGFYAPEEEMTEEDKRATALSDQLIAELKEADEILVSGPMYNLSVPSALKAYIDQVTRVRHTIRVGEQGYYGLLAGKVGYTITTKGGYYKGTESELYDFYEPYVKTMLEFIGIKVKGQISLEGTSLDTNLTDTKAKVKTEIDQLIHNTI